MDSSRRKILFLIPTLAGGGAERFFSILLRHLNRSLFEPHLALFKLKGEYLQDVPEDVVIHDLRCSRGRYAIPSLIRLILKLRPGAVLSTLPPANMALTMSRLFLPRGTRLLLSEAIHVSADLKSYPNRRLWTWLIRRFYKLADKVVCLCDSMVDDMATHFNVPRDKLVRIYYPVDLKRVCESAETGSNPFVGMGPHLLAAGRLCPQKGFDVFLDAMCVVRANLPQAKLVILGQGPLHDELMEQARKLGLAESVSFPGFQQNPWPYFHHADLFVLSSRYEGLPNVLLEALALGTPIVATDCPGAIREMSALYPDLTLVPPENAPRLAEAIISMCKRSCQEGKTAPRVPRDLSNFGLERVLGEYSDLLLS